MKTITAFVVRAIGFCIHHARWVIGGLLVLAVVSSWYAATHFSMTTDINQLISSNSPGRQREQAFEKAFPQFDTIVAVIDAPTPEQVEAATTALVGRLATQKSVFRTIDEPQGGAFFAENGLLFAPVDQLGKQLSLLQQAQRLVQVLAADPSLRGVIRTLQFGMLGVQSGKLKLDNMVWPLTLAADTLDQVNADKPASFSWRVLVQGQEPKPTDLMRIPAHPGGARLFRARARAEGK